MVVVLGDGRGAVVGEELGVVVVVVDFCAFFGTVVVVVVVGSVNWNPLNWSNNAAFCSAPWAMRSCLTISKNFRSSSERSRRASIPC